MNKKTNFLAAFSLLSQIGMMMVLPIIFCILLGNYLDSKLNTGIIFLIIFTLLGVGAAFRNLFVLSSKCFKSGNKRKDQK